VAQIVLPKDCKGNKFCEITKMIVGPTVKWYIAGQFEWKKIRVATGFANIRLFAGLYFHKLELYVEVSRNINMRIPVTFSFQPSRVSKRILCKKGEIYSLSQAKDQEKI